jgi:hypothetical protein
MQNFKIDVQKIFKSVQNIVDFAQKLLFCCFNLIRLLHYFRVSIIIYVPESVVTDTGKNTAAEAAYLSQKVRFSATFSHFRL